VAIACNVIRLVPTIYLFGELPLSWAEKVHDVSGWMMLPIAFMLLYGTIALLRWALLPVASFTLAYD
jgi:exosortase/archaeosortase family protein